MPDPDTGSAVMRVAIDGKEYEFDPARDLTIGVMRHVKQWYPALGNYSAFLLGLVNGDPDAVACTMWIVKRKAGESTPEPHNIDFAIGAFMQSVNRPTQEEVEAEPDTQTLGSDTMSTTSELETSPDSPTTSE